MLPDCLRRARRRGKPALGMTPGKAPTGVVFLSGAGGGPPDALYDKGGDRHAFPFPPDLAEALAEAMRDLVNIPAEGLKGPRSAPAPPPGGRSSPARVGRRPLSLMRNRSTGCVPSRSRKGGAFPFPPGPGRGHHRSPHLVPAGVGQCRSGTARSFLRPSVTLPPITGTRPALSAPDPPVLSPPNPSPPACAAGGALIGDTL